MANTLFCTFCGKSQHEVLKLIAGPTVFICGECVMLCMEIVNESSRSVDGEAEYLSWDGVEVPPPNSTMVPANALIKEMVRRGYSISRLLQSKSDG